MGLRASFNRFEGIEKRFSRKLLHRANFIVVVSSVSPFVREIKKCDKARFAFKCDSKFLAD
jgi:hypothetical protein